MSECLNVDPNKPAGEQVFSYVSKTYEESRLADAKHYVRYVLEVEARAKNTIKRAQRALVEIAILRSKTEEEIDNGGTGSSAHEEHYQKCNSLLRK